MNASGETFTIYGTDPDSETPTNIEATVAANGGSVWFRLREPLHGKLAESFAIWFHHFAPDAYGPPELVPYDEFATYPFYHLWWD